MLELAGHGTRAAQEDILAKVLLSDSYPRTQHPWYYAAPGGSVVIPAERREAVW